MALRQKPASASHDLILVELQDVFNPRLKDSLQRKGFSFRNVKGLDNADQLLKQLVNPIIVIQCGRAPIDELTADLLLRERFFNSPLIVIGRDIDGVQAKLSDAFNLITTLREPCQPTELLSAINHLADLYQPREEPARARKARSRAEGFEKEAGPASAVETPPAEDGEEAPGPVHAGYSSAESVPSLYFQQLEEYRLLDKTLGGVDLVRADPRELHLQEKLLPAHPHSRYLVGEVFEKAGKWIHQHLNRTAFLCRALLMPLSLEDGAREDAKAAVYLFSLALLERHRSLLRKEFTGRGSMLIRKELCSMIKDSAFQLSSEHQSPSVGTIVAKLARLIGREEAPADDEVSLIASAIMASDLTCRTCFQSGHWNPRAAHSLLKRLRLGKLKEFHPAILCALAKVLSEALAGHTAAYLLPKHIRENPELMARAKANAEQPVGDGELKVALNSLAPGMRLSQPLVAFDGRQLLDPDLVLDQDLIWRIWQLSAVRPINSPVIVNKSAEGKE